MVDATDTRLGRLASFVAKKALEGESIAIVNAEKAIITGNEDDIKKKYKTRRDVGDRYKGPFFPRMPDRIVRGMLPYKTKRGREAYRRVKVFIGLPKEFEGKEIVKLEWTKDRLKHQKFIYVEELARWLGARW